MMRDRDADTGAPDDMAARLDGWVADGCHHYPLRVQFEDTDAGGIVYHDYICDLLDPAEVGELIELAKRPAGTQGNRI